MPRFGSVIGQLPPFALARWTFPLSALAAQVGRAPLGGPREATLASLVTARLCVALLPPYDIDGEGAAARSSQAKIWLSGLTLGVGLKTTLTSIIDAAGLSNRVAAANSVEKLTGIGSLGLDSAAREELEKLISDLRE